MPFRAFISSSTFIKQPTRSTYHTEKKNTHESDENQIMTVYHHQPAKITMHKLTTPAITPPVRCSKSPYSLVRPINGEITSQLLGIGWMVEG